VRIANGYTELINSESPQIHDGLDMTIFRRDSHSDTASPSGGKIDGSLKKKLREVHRALALQERRLANSVAKLREKEKSYGQEIVYALGRGKRNKAVVFAQELAQVRKAVDTLTQARSAIEQISLRLGTIQEVGDLTADLGLALNVLQGLNTKLTGLTSSAEEEWNSLADLAESFVSESSGLQGSDLVFSASSDYAERILSDAERDARIEEPQASKSSEHTREAEREEA
jgi:division protein CdvB (Snf7/Vps24/ESCRT-III family)